MSKKLIVITGVTHGLGRAMAREFARHGHSVAGCGRSEKEIETLREDLSGDHDFAKVDVSSDDETKNWAASVLAAQGPADLLLNNAGIINKNARLWEISAQEFSLVVDVNLKGVANVIRHFVPPMIQRRKGIIVNFSSGWGRSADAEVAPYCATKWGIEGLTQAFAQELPDGMAVVALNPGIINTRMLQSCFGASASHYVDAEQWARTAVPFLLSLSPKDNGKQLTAPG
jgi:NAD(P)-dependent dehydrogenase (short-subunit alcohol dehydrogenase family)